MASSMGVEGALQFQMSVHNNSKLPNNFNYFKTLDMIARTRTNCTYQRKDHYNDGSNNGESTFPSCLLSSWIAFSTALLYDSAASPLGMIFPLRNLVKCQPNIPKHKLSQSMYVYTSRVG